MAYSVMQNQSPPSYLLPTKLWFYENKATNYVVWRAQCLDLFARQNVIGYINGTIIIPPAALPVVSTSHPVDLDLLRTKDVELKQWIISVLDDGVADPTNIDKKTCREIWLELEVKFQELFGQIPTWSTGSAAGTEGSQEYLLMYQAAIRDDKNAIKHKFNNDISVFMIKNPNSSMVCIGEQSNSTNYPKDRNVDLVVFPKHTSPIYAQTDMLEYLKSFIIDDQSLYSNSAGVALLLSAIDSGHFDFATILVEEFPHLATLKLSFNSALTAIASKMKV